MTGDWKHKAGEDRKSFHAFGSICRHSRLKAIVSKIEKCWSDFLPAKKSMRKEGRIEIWGRCK